MTILRRAQLHVPGRHDQRSHTPGKYGKGSSAKGGGASAGGSAAATKGAKASIKSWMSGRMSGRTSKEKAIFKKASDQVLKGYEKGGASGAIAAAKKVTSGGFHPMKSGGASVTIDMLRSAGVDMKNPF